MDYTSIFQNFNDVEVLAACNGLVLIGNTRNSFQELYIWNPTRNEYKNMSMPEEVDKDDIHGYGFCYDYKTNEYKLVRIVVDRESECSSIDVYTLSSNSWKRIPDTFPSLSQRIFWCPLEWISSLACAYFCTFVQPSTVLVCFDIVNERFEEVAMPEAPMPYQEEPLERDMFQINVEVLGGCICLVFHIFNVRVDVWIMQDYGVRESWTKSFSINQASIISSRDLYLLWSFKNNETLWMLDHDFVLYDPNKKLYRKLMLDSHITISRFRCLTNQGAGLYSA
ncbi:F-box/kelch-repeat protein At3g06240-like [Papaver somniferum]|uniref:F-box/kelch-repeat protein At3g06240-like n=1 Tax=Papaver somniferum TaxID=3469 RepID=UPI000E702213|nr:F-box/kelch-repeat protein At3g06240-like [Papaver somniferum]